MNLSRYIASHISGSKDNASNYSRPVVVIGVVSIVLSLSVMIIATSVVTGFKRSVTQKMSGVASHITITNLDNNTSFETKPIVQDIGLMNSILQTEHVRHIQPYALKHAIIKTKKEIQGILIKGVDSNFDWNSFAPNILEGERINPADTNGKNKVMITKALSDAMGLKVGDTLFTYYISQPRRILRERVIKDHSSTLFYSMIPQDSAEIGLGMVYNTSNPEVFKFFNYVLADSFSSRLPEPRVMQLKVSGIFETGIYELDQQLVMGPLSLVQDMYRWTPDNISGYEIYVDNFGNESGIESYIRPYQQIFIPGYKDPLTQTYESVSFVTPGDLYPSDIRSNYPEIFEWLPAIDVNGVIIRILMVLVSIMAMLSTLLILIMEKTQTIGVLKALGMNNWGIQKVFLWHASFIIIRGMLIGNIIGIGLVLIQHFWHPILLDQNAYYLPYVPVEVDWIRYLSINIGTFVICVLALVIPSFVVSRITPVKAIRLD